jgi:hypothetical protein
MKKKIIIHIDVERCRYILSYYIIFNISLFRIDVDIIYLGKLNKLVCYVILYNKTYIL